MLGNLGPMELLMILVIVLVVFGAKRVPEIGASLGQGIREFKRSMTDIASGEPLRSVRDDQPLPRPAAATDEAREPKRLLS